MIVYETGLFGLRNLTRVHGSAVYKTFFPALLSTFLLLLYHYYRVDTAQVFSNLEQIIVGDNGVPTTTIEIENVEQVVPVVKHPYLFGAFIAFFSFLLTFRLNFSYGRYWEAASSVFMMHSKWLSVATDLAAFHYQSSTPQLNALRPPAFGNNPTANSRNIVGQERGFRGMSLEETMLLIAVEEQTQLAQRQRGLRKLFRNPFRSMKQRQTTASKHSDAGPAPANQKTDSNHSDAGPVQANQMPPKNRDRPWKQHATLGKSINPPKRQSREFHASTMPVSLRFQHQFWSSRLRRRKMLLDSEDINKSTRHLTNNLRVGMPAPTIFLQETAHLISLLSAVALSTLRNDLEEAPSPIMEYVPGKPWPPVDPDDLERDIKHAYGDDTAFWRWLYFCLGLSRSDRHRVLYNASRPFGVLGGVSDAEIELLQAARGPYAKVALCTLWLQEFISRESLAGSTGAIASPIISRLYQFVSDGVRGYNQARKVAYVPFPFPHGQMTAFFSLTVIFIFPMLFSSFVNLRWFAGVLNFLTVMCFLGLHEVARELEQPFANVPNDLPLTTFQAQFNEALVTIYTGYHPDAYWKPKPERIENQFQHYDQLPEVEEATMSVASTGSDMDCDTAEEEKKPHA